MIRLFILAFSGVLVSLGILWWTLIWVVSHG